VLALVVDRGVYRVYRSGRTWLRCREFVQCDVADRAGRQRGVFSGGDSLTLPIMSLGGRGVIAVVSNILPDRLLKLVNAALEGDYAAAREQHYALLPHGRTSLE
jgi:dihydrodipicolinate synthase/N-acetylneuraminate lyase